MNSKARLASIDTLRGLVMLHIVGGVVVMKSLAAFLPAAAGAWLVAQMSHAPWGADRIHDYVFPTFLFLTGVSWPFSLASQVARGRTTAQIHRKILLRMTVLILLGLVCGGILRLDWVHIRLASVLGRIGIAWAVAAFIFMHTGFRRQLAICAALLVGYWAIICFIPRPDVVIPPGESSLSAAKYCICGWMDRNYLQLPMTLPQCDGGAFATLGMPVTALFGAMAGALLRRTDLSGGRKTLLMLAAAAVLALLGVAGLPWCPNVKGIWTPTYALISGGVALALLAVLYWIVDVKGWRAWSTVFTVVGVNAITIYMMNKFMNFRGMSNYFFGGIASRCSPEVGALILSVGVVVIVWLILWFFDRKKIYLKV